ncbi:class III lanthionine synthetase LanKC [Stigmatella aurantiaca]|nr:class III lanthionine synthetase LanKC [Stigmatella aurantiaca]ADO74919.1 Protein kinase [Stigmatella aurantiaca DW4/3-1]
MVECAFSPSPPHPMQGIERRAKRDIFFFTLTDPERYESLEDYRSTSTEFRDLVRGLLPAGWKMDYRQGTWCPVFPPEDKTPDEGFKIHASTKHENAQQLLRAAVPLFVEEGVAFKFVVDEDILDFTNESARGRGGCGKFITAYPVDVPQLRRLMERLHEATRDLTGPYILSDQRYKDSKTLFYRYGSFKNRFLLNVFGEQEPYMRAPDGSLVPDERQAYFVLPEGVEDPFPQEPEEDSGELILQGRYKVTSALSMSAKGGVYAGEDLQTGAQVVIKEARPLINRNRRSPHDAVACLHNEYRILSLLAGTGVAPQPIAFFQEWEHSFLVMDYVKGVPLSSLRAFEDFSLMLMTDIRDEDVQRFAQEYLQIARQLILGVRAIHAQGVVIQDVAPQNILFDLEQAKVTFIDFESAWSERLGEHAVVAPIRTLGFGDHQWNGQRPTMEEDQKALGRLLSNLIFPITPLLSLAPGHWEPFLRALAQEKGLPAPLLSLVLGTTGSAAEVDRLLENAEHQAKDARAAPRRPPQRTAEEHQETVRRIARYIVDQIEGPRGPLDLPTDYRRAATNPLNVAYGAAGVALFLHRAQGTVPTALREALLREAATADNEHYPPGLYVGTAGIAWTLLELGHPQEAERLLEMASHSPLLFKNADLFFGSAGYGLTQLFFHQRLKQASYLTHALQTFEGLKTSLQEAQGLYFYPNEGAVYHGLAHGASGIAYFLLRLFQATGQKEVLQYARGLMDFELAQAQKQNGQLVWQRSSHDAVHSPYWRVGSAGIGSVLLRFHAALGDPRYLDTARQIAHYLEGKYSVFPGNLSGMAGLGHFLIDMFKASQEEKYRQEAFRFADRIMLYALEREGGLVFPGEELIRISTDLGTGSAGIGLFLDRLLKQDGIPYLDD